MQQSQLHVAVNVWHQEEDTSINLRNHGRIQRGVNSGPDPLPGISQDLVRIGFFRNTSMDPLDPKGPITPRGLAICEITEKKTLSEPLAEFSGSANEIHMINVGNAAYLSCF